MLPRPTGPMRCLSRCHAGLDRLSRSAGNALRHSVNWSALLLLATLSATVWADAGQLVNYYRQMQLDPPATHATLPFSIDSSDNADKLSADIYGSIRQPFDHVTAALTRPGNWCEFMPLNLNIKSCVAQQRNGQTALTFYAGRKYYESPEAAYPLHYSYRVAASDRGYMKVMLTAKQGPFGTTDYLIVIEAIPAEDNTFVHIHSSYRTSLSSRLGTRLYLSTLGQDKVGFTITGRTDAGAPVYIKGIRGIIERNVMRYYLALQAFIETAQHARDKRFEARIRTWFDLTERYATQLHELERDEYLQAKRQERRQQLRLQQSLLDL